MYYANLFQVEMVLEARELIVSGLTAYLLFEWNIVEFAYYAVHVSISLEFEANKQNKNSRISKFFLHINEQIKLSASRVII